MTDNQNIYIRSVCGALTAEGRCSIYGQAERPRMCGIWPDDPETQAPEGCGYRTKVIERRV